MNQEDELLSLFKNVNEFIPIFQALADSERLLILLKLFYAGPNGKNVTELSGKTRLSRPAVSHHLKVLKVSIFETVQALTEDLRKHNKNNMSTLQQATAY